MKPRKPQIRVYRNARRLGARCVAALALGMAMAGQSQAGSIDADRFASLVMACIEETSFNSGKNGAVAQAVAGLELQPLNSGEEETFASVKAGFGSEFLLSLSPDISDINKEKQLNHMMLDPDFRAMILKRVREKNQKEAGAGPTASFLNPFPVVDEEGRTRSYWWLDQPSMMTAEFSNMGFLLSSHGDAICQFTNIPNSWAQKLIDTPDLSFKVETLGGITRHSALIDTISSIPAALDFSATELEQVIEMLNARVQMTHYTDIPTTENPTGKWVLTVLSPKTPRG